MGRVGRKCSHLWIRAPVYWGPLGVRQRAPPRGWGPAYLTGEGPRVRGIQFLGIVGKWMSRDLDRLTAPLGSRSWVMWAESLYEDPQELCLPVP